MKKIAEFKRCSYVAKTFETNFSLKIFEEKCSSEQKTSKSPMETNLHIIRCGEEAAEHDTVGLLEPTQRELKITHGPRRSVVPHPKPSDCFPNRSCRTAPRRRCHRV